MILTTNDLKVGQKVKVINEVDGRSCYKDLVGIVVMGGCGIGIDFGRVLESSHNLDGKLDGITGRYPSYRDTFILVNNKQKDFIKKLYEKSKS